MHEITHPLQGRLVQQGAGGRRRCGGSGGGGGNGRSGSGARSRREGTVRIEVRQEGEACEWNCMAIMVVEVSDISAVLSSQMPCYY